MNEAKYELKNWIKWKRTVQLLEETKEQVRDMKKAVSIDVSSIPGTGHVSMISKFNTIIYEIDEYDKIIDRYNFFINRLESSLTKLLTKEQREVCIIYANYRNSNTREKEAFIKGYSQASFYRILKESFDLLNTVLNPIESFEHKFDSNLIVKNDK